jgi:RNA polymerase primary sigma factor
MTRHQRKDRRHASGHLDAYLDTVRDDGLLSAEEERTLAEAIRRGDGDARARMIRSNLRLVVKIARDYLGRGLALDDLVGEGNLGLIRATEEFDPAYGTRFSTYAAYWIRQAIRHALVNTTATIRLPAHMVNLLTKWRRAERALGRVLGFAPSFDQVADELDLPVAKRRMVAQALDALRLCGQDDGEAARWEETPADLAAPSSALEAAEERVLLLARLDRLDARERAVVALRFGLGGGDPLTFREIGGRLGLSSNWVRQLETNALRRLG